jgi:vacuolar-type H+-ATPase subunit I/STV1
MENVIFEKVKHQAEHLKSLLEEVQVQIALGKAEAKDKIEEEKKLLSQYFSKQRREMEQEVDALNKERKEFLAHIESLERMLVEEIPTDVEAYDDYKLGVLEAIYKIEEDVRDYYPALSNDLHGELDIFKSKLDAFRVNLALHDKDNPERIQGIRADFAEKIEEIRNKLGKKEAAESKLEHFIDDIGHSFSYFKKAIEDLLD